MLAAYSCRRHPQPDVSAAGSRTSSVLMRTRPSDVDMTVPTAGWWAKRSGVPNHHREWSTYPGWTARWRATSMLTGLDPGPSTMRSNEMPFRCLPDLPAVMSHVLADLAAVEAEGLHPIVAMRDGRCQRQRQWRGDQHEAMLRRRIGLGASKYWVCESCATPHAAEALECSGRNGYFRGVGDASVVTGSAADGHLEKVRQCPSALARCAPWQLTTPSALKVLFRRAGRTAGQDARLDQQRRAAASGTGPRPQ